MTWLKKIWRNHKEYHRIYREDPTSHLPGEIPCSKLDAIVGGILFGGMISFLMYLMVMILKAKK